MKEMQGVEIEKIAAEEILYKELGEIALEISSKLDAERSPREPYDHSRYNWASEIPHPCKKFLVHARVDWKRRQQIDIDGRWRVDEGSRIEWEVKKWLGDIGYEITKSQRKFNTDDPGMEDFSDLRITCKIDGASPLNRKLPEPFSYLRDIPVEIKTVNPNYWNSTKTIEDINRHPKFWIRKMTAQLNIGIALSRSPGGLLIIATFGKKPRILPMLFDPDLWDRDQKMAREVNAHVEAGTYPRPIPFDATVCGLCDFNHVCTPVSTTKMSEVDPMDIFKLEMYLELKEQKEKFDAIHAELIGSKKKPGKYRGLDAIIEDIEINTRRHIRKIHKIPPEEKEKYYVGDEEVIVTTIERMGK